MSVSLLWNQLCYSWFSGSNIHDAEDMFSTVKKLFCTTALNVHSPVCMTLHVFLLHGHHCFSMSRNFEKFYFYFNCRKATYLNIVLVWTKINTRRNLASCVQEGCSKTGQYSECLGQGYGYMQAD